MGSAIRAIDWSATPMGPVARWPESLRTSVRLCLGSRFPMTVWCGSELVIFYNDAFIPLLGRRHPHALGQPAKLIWPDAWSQITPQVEAVMQRGESAWNERTHFVLTRNGFPEDAWFTWSFAPVRGPTGEVLGIYGTYVEDTARVLAEKAREQFASEQLRQSADVRARTILESITEAFFALDAQWCFTYLNPQSFVLLGRPPEDLVGKSMWEEYPGLYGSPFEPIYRGVAATRKAASIVAYFESHQRWYDVRAYPAEDGGLSVYFRDVSQQRVTEDQREKLLESERMARSEAERAGRMKDEFLATLSHELRTPLNAILGWCDILVRSGQRSEAELNEGLNTIERNARAQAQIIADILDMSSIIAGKMRVVFRPTDLGVIVRDAIETARPAAEAKGVQLLATLDPAISLIAGDPNRLQQILWNLLSNALKFTARGGSVAVVLKRVDSQVGLSVTDTGIGIKPELLPYVFDRFRQGDASTTRKHGGLGLGLSIVKQLVELHGGTIEVDSAGVGQGATFLVMLPLSAVQPAIEPMVSSPGRLSKPQQLAPAEGALRGVKVLVLDDEPDARALVKRLLEDYGATVAAASSVQEALQLLRAEKPDVLVSDIGMPVEDGYSLIRKIRALSPVEGGETPALALTAYARPEDHDRSIKAGFQMHIPKPVEPLELVHKVAGLAEKARSSNGSRPMQVTSSPVERSRLQPLRILLVEDHDTTREAITMLLEYREHVVFAAGSLSEARTAVESGPFDLVISDVNLPDGSGNDLMAELRSRFGLKGIALTGYGDADALIRSEEAGFVIHLTKPVRIEALERALAAASSDRN